MSGLSGGIEITQDRVIESRERVNNPKINEAVTFTARLKENSVTSRELSDAFSVEYFDTVADLRANATTISDGTRVQPTGYFTAGANDAGPAFTVDISDTTTADDGFSCLVDANSVRYKRTFAEQINMKWSGYRSSADGTETYASANDTAWAAVKAYLDTNPGSVLIPADGDNVYYYSADQEAAADCIYTLDGTMKKKADTGAHGFELPSGLDNITLKGFGKIDGNAQMTSPRTGGNGILATDNENVTIYNVRVDNCEGHAVNIRQPVGLVIDGMYVRNTFGSVKSGSGTSGINMDGIHVYNPNDVVITNCNVRSIDDCISITTLDAYTADCKGVTISGCVTENVKAENATTSGDGSNALIIGAGYRIAEDHGNTGSTRRIRDVTISDGFHKGGDSGMLLGTTGLTTTTKWVERVQVSNMHFVDVASPTHSGSITAFADAGGGQVTVTSAAHGLANNATVTISGTTNYNGNFTATNVTANTFEITDTWVINDGTGTWTQYGQLSLNRALTAGIWCRGIADANFSNITCYNAGVPAVMTDICENVAFDTILAVDGTVDANNGAVGNEFERAHYLIRGSQNASDRVYLTNFRSVNADGAGLVVNHDGGAGKEVTNLHLQGTVDNPNQHGGSQDDHSAVYLVNQDAGEIVEYDVEVINFTPSGNVIEMARSSSAVLIEKLAPLNIQAWHTDIYSAAGNWFTRIQLFGPTFAVDNHFEGVTYVLQVDQGTTHVTGTAQAGTADTITLAAGESGLNDAFNGLTINITGGLGAGQSKTITDYVGSTKEATVDSSWSTNPDATSTYEIEDAGGDGIYSVPLAGGSLNDKHVCAEFMIHIDSGSVNVVEDSTLGVVTDTLTTTGSWLLIKKIWAPYQTSTRIGFVCAETPTTFYLGPMRVYEL